MTVTSLNGTTLQLLSPIKQRMETIRLNLYLYISSAMLVVPHKMAANPKDSPSSILVSGALTEFRGLAERTAKSSKYDSFEQIIKSLN